MKITVKFAGGIACATGNSRKVDYELGNCSSLYDLIDFVDQQFSGLKNSICGDKGEVADHVNVYVNGDNVRYLRGLDTELSDGDMVHIIPAAAAG